ncbi:hypothetical protein PanWU01x14_061880 [Parasponia andersonii]|uniref:Uncharacterized protein n=1 Tax=Parasponia andersonii TaxID=3476 RepID=A0A2P5DIA5_PARAD|nr:hypothetical protein PanWU01x14_061880 [Parasponia andersonii]
MQDGSLQRKKIKKKRETSAELERVVIFQIGVELGLVWAHGRKAQTQTGFLNGLPSNQKSLFRLLLDAKTPTALKPEIELAPYKLNDQARKYLCAVFTVQESNAATPVIYERHNWIPKEAHDDFLQMQGLVKWLCCFKWYHEIFDWVAQ